MMEFMRQNASGWIIKILFGIIIIAFVFTFGMSSFDRSNDPIMAYVDGAPISRVEFENAYRTTLENLRQSNKDVTAEQLQDPAIKQQVLEQLVNNQLLLAEGARLGVAASPAEIQQLVMSMKAFQTDNKFNPELYKAVLQQQHLTPAGFEHNFAIELVSRKLLAYASIGGVATPDQAKQLYQWIREKTRIKYLAFSPEKYLNTVGVSDEELAAYYEENKERLVVPAMANIRYIAFTPEYLAKFQTVTDEDIKDYFEAHKDTLIQQEEVHARHILIPVAKDASAEVVAEAEKSAMDILAKAKGGQDFAELARKYSQGPSAPLGGDLGWFARGVMVPSFEEAAFKLAKGEISQPVRTPFGFHLIQVVDRKEAGSATLADMSDTIRAQLAEDKAAEKFTSLMDDALDRMLSGMSLEDTANELGLETRTTQPMPVTGFTETFGMTPEAAQTLFDLPKGQTNQTPLAIKGGYILAEKIEDVPSSYRTMESVASSLTMGLKAKKARAKAMEEAQAVLKELTDNPGPAAAKLAESAMESEPFDRNGNIPGLGTNPLLAAAAFNADSDGWLPTPFEFPQTVIIAKPGERIAPSEATWLEQEQQWITQASNNYTQENLAAYLQELRAKGKVEIVRTDLLN